MPPKVDFHIHTHHIGCANHTMTIPAIITQCEKLGLEKIAITDHCDKPEHLDRHRLIRQDLQNINTSLKVYFAAELDYVQPEGPFLVTPQIKQELGFQFIIAGIHSTFLEHYNLNQLIETQHRYHIKTCLNPFVEVLVHPYWFGRSEFDSRHFPWFDSLDAIPHAFIRELAQASRDTQTAIEINGHANLNNPAFSQKYTQQYQDYLTALAHEGAIFSIGSDAHDISWLSDINLAQNAAQNLNLTPTRFWQPNCPPFNKPV